MAGNNKIEKIGDYRRGPLRLNLGMIIFGTLFIYMVICVIMYFNTEHIVGYEVVEGSLSAANVYEGMAVRDETVYSCSGAGYINFFAREAEHVACGDLIYTLDSSGRIAELMAAQEEEFLLSDTDLNSIKNQIIQFQNDFSYQDYEKLYSFKDQMDGTALKLTNYNMLNNMDSLVGSDSGNVSFQYAPTSGVVVYGIDGYEDIMPKDINAGMFGENRKQQVQLDGNQLVTGDDKAYKLIGSENWSIIIPMDARRAAELQAEEYVQVKFLKNQYVSWAKVNTLNNADGTYLQLDFTNSMITFAADRFVDIEILYNNEKGLKIPNSAIVEQEFFLIPHDYKLEGGDSANGIFLKESYDEEGKLRQDKVEARIYASDDEFYYVDTSRLRIGDYICKMDSTEKMAVSKVGSLIGVYNINRGYADFTAITILYANEEYSIVKSNTTYGLSEYDYIVLDADTVNVDDFIYE